MTKKRSERPEYGDPSWRRRSGPVAQLPRDIKSAIDAAAPIAAFVPGGQLVTAAKGVADIHDAATAAGELVADALYDAVNSEEDALSDEKWPSVTVDLGKTKVVKTKDPSSGNSSTVSVTNADVTPPPGPRVSVPTPPYPTPPSLPMVSPYREQRQDPPPNVDSDPVQPVLRLTGWRAALLKYLKGLAPASPLDAEVIDFLSTSGLHILTAMGMTESNGVASAHNKADGSHAAWGRKVDSVGIFQIREPTADWLYKSRRLAAPFKPFPLGPHPERESNRLRNVAVLQKYPEQLLYGIILARIAIRWAIDDFGFDPAHPSAPLVSRSSHANPALVKFLNSYGEKGLVGVTPFAALLRLYWAASSKGGPAYMKRNDIAEKVIDGHGRSASYGYLARLQSEAKLIHGGE